MQKYKHMNYLLQTDSLIYHSMENNSETLLLHHYFGIAIMTKFWVVQGFLVQATLGSFYILLHNTSISSTSTR